MHGIGDRWEANTLIALAAQRLWIFLSKPQSADHYPDLRELAKVPGWPNSGVELLWTELGHRIKLMESAEMAWSQRSGGGGQFFLMGLDLDD